MDQDVTAEQCQGGLQQPTHKEALGQVAHAQLLVRQVWMCLSSLAASTEVEEGGSLFLLQLMLSQGCFLQPGPHWEVLSLLSCCAGSRGGGTWEQPWEDCAQQAPCVLFG